MSREQYMTKEQRIEFWYGAAIVVLACVYIFCWFCTIYLATGREQQQSGSGLLVLEVNGDSRQYVALAHSLLTSHTFPATNHSPTPFVPETFRVPGYPLFVAIFSLFGKVFFVTTLVQIILAFCTAFLIRRLGCFFFSDTVGCVAAVLFLLDPTTLLLSLALLSDMLFVFLFIAGFYLLVSRLHKKPLLVTVSAGLIFSYAVCVRPVGLFALPIFFAPVFISKASLRHKIYSAIGILVIITAAVAPWMWRNYKEAGAFTFSSLPAYNIAKYNIPIFLATRGVTAEESRALVEKKSGVSPDRWRDVEASAALNKASRNILGHQLLSYVVFHIEGSVIASLSSSLNTFISTYNTIVPISIDTSPIKLSDLLISWKQSVFIFGHFWWRFVEGFMWAGAFACAGVAFWIHRRYLFSWAFVLIVVYILLLIGPVVDVRYRTPAVPFIFLMAVAGAGWLRKRLFD